MVVVMVCLYVFGSGVFSEGGVVLGDVVVFLRG